MKRFWNLFKTDLRRAFGVRLWLLCLGVTALFLLSLSHYYFLGGEDFCYRIKLAELPIFIDIMLVFSTAAYGVSFCEDWDNRNIRNLFVRAGAKKYAASKVASCFLASFTVLFIGKLLLVLSQLAVSPVLFNPDVFDGMQSPAGSVDALAYTGNFGGWVLVNLVRFALEGTVFSVLALAVSTVLTNKFVVLVVPLIVRMLYQCATIGGFIPAALTMSNLFEDSYCSLSVFQGLLRPVLISLASCLLFGCLFFYGVKRRLENG
ncbi:MULTISPECIES: hypothetical protein [Caproicibacterium]|uniref:Uncharacterized protein n=1 Tax=Caproicibacterium argilliputei TaxID=3030016 RepID=A0AA97DCL6_9FIRM|nr:hypothetical protein [Caproicibacterium argilliputei]WOC33098.1 hypothetical protein PXC00_04250 [Caproicibacterium argilliputei]